MADERWLAVPGFEGRYEVSSDGRVRALYKGLGVAATVPRFVKGSDNGAGYRRVTLVDGAGRRCERYVHALVLTAFVGPCPEGLECRHENGMRGDNRLSNLSWGTQLENVTDRRRHGTERSPLTPEAVRAIRAAVAQGAKHADVAQRYGVHRATITKVANGRRWAHV